MGDPGERNTVIGIYFPCPTFFIFVEHGLFSAAWSPLWLISSSVYSPFCLLLYAEDKVEMSIFPTLSNIFSDEQQVDKALDSSASRLSYSLVRDGGGIGFYIYFFFCLI